MKTKFFLAFLILITSQTALCSAQNVEKLYTICNPNGREISYSQLTRELTPFDLVFFGEFHNDPISHWLEYLLTRDLSMIHKNKFALGMEMFERDNQIIIDEYLNKLISSDRFEKECRLWPNYYPDYYRVVDLAKEKGFPVIATNIPRRYANSVSKSGLSILEKFSDEAKKFMPPFPIELDIKKEDESFFESMNKMGRQGKSSKNIVVAQALKDLTMAWNIFKNSNKKIFHINGCYHTMNNSGIVHYLKKIAPSKKIAIINMVKDNEAYKNRKAKKSDNIFYIYIPEEMSTTY